MADISSDAMAYLNQLNLMAGSDPDVKVAMHEVGKALGIDKALAGRMAETLFMGGYAELKTLSGGIGITLLGLSELGTAPKGEDQVKESLGRDVVLKQAPIDCVNTILDDLKVALSGTDLEYEKIDQVVMDIKTIEVQLLSPQPKTAVVREVFKSLAQALDVPGVADIKARLKILIRVDP